MARTKSLEVRATDDKTYVTLENLKTYKTKYDEKVDRIVTDINKKIELNTARIFTSTKDNLEKADSDVIKEYFTQHSDVHPRKGDVFLITTTVEQKTYEQSAYTYGDSDWEAITGNVDAEKVIMRNNITLAGNYTQVGNITKGANETKTLDVKGKSLKEVMCSIFTVKLQPANPTQPSVTGFNLTGAKAVEAGTKVASTTFGNANLTAGSYQFGPATGVTAQAWKIDRVTNVPTLNVKVADANSGTDDNGGSGFIIGDQGGDNVVSTLKYTATATHNEGVVAHDNLGGQSNPQKKIEAGTKQATTSAYSCFRNFFYGATAEKPTLDSNYVRTLTKSNRAYSRGDITITVPVGATRVCIACIGTATGVTRVINTSALNADVTDTFKMTKVQVEGAEKYHPVEYKVWSFEPPEAYGQQAVLKVTLG